MTFGRWFELVWVSWTMECGWKLFISKLSGFLVSVRAWEQHWPGGFPPSTSFALPPQVAGSQQGLMLTEATLSTLLQFAANWWQVGSRWAASLGPASAGKCSCFISTHNCHRLFHQSYQKGEWINNLSKLDSFFIPRKSFMDQGWSQEMSREKLVFACP